LYHSFINQQGLYANEYCKIYFTYGHAPRLFPVLQKYSNLPNTIFCDFYGPPTHHTNQCRTLDALVDRLDCIEFQVNETP